ncbi:hypothetical protein FKM82_026272, partial [Ascaphus truei]
MPSPVRELLRGRSPGGDVGRASGEYRDREESARTVQGLPCRDPPRRTPVTDTLTSLAEDVRQNCYSACELGTQDSPTGDPVSGDIVEESLSDEEYLTISSTSVTPLSCEVRPEEPPAVFGTPQPRSLIPLPESFAVPESCDSEWEDLDEPEGEEQSRCLLDACTGRPAPFPAPSPTRRTHAPYTAVRSKAPSPIRRVPPSPTIKILPPSPTRKPPSQSPTAQVSHKLGPCGPLLQMNVPLCPLATADQSYGQARAWSADGSQDDVITLNHMTAGMSDDAAWALRHSSPG